MNDMYTLWNKIIKKGSLVVCKLASDAGVLPRNDSKQTPWLVLLMKVEEDNK